MTLRTPIGTAHAVSSDGSVTHYTVHAADTDVLHVTRGDADAGTSSSGSICTRTPTQRSAALHGVRLLPEEEVR
ncbi:hypothetical protein [Streptomyces sp. NBC_01431]|uniref:hypothetical protein n=1 Tax=Streptomyces sp. NBC_01431 TaxID=2903863 RepID=UPI002E349627|nr:hypothetical protein [Streptomyces sp. NBC_01431]